MCDRLPTPFLRSVLRDVLAEQGLDPDSSYRLTSDVPRLWVSSVFRVTVTPAGRDELCLFVKCLPADRAMLEAMQVRALFENESAFYNIVVAAFWKLGPFRGAPRCYRALCEEEDCVLVLEDLKVRGFDVRNRLHSWGFADLRLVMQEVGRFQAFSFALKQKHPSILEEAKSAIREVVYDGEILERFSDIVAFSQADALALVQENFPDSQYAEKLGRFVRNPVERIQNVVKVSEECFAVISHGDIWASNIMFGRSETRLIDFQTCRYAQAGLDVAYVFFTMADKATRDEHGVALLDAYYGALEGTLKQLGGSVEEAMSREELNNQLAVGALYALSHGYEAIVWTLDEEPVGDESLDDGADKLKIPFGRKSRRCKQKLLDMITDIIDRGYLDNLD